MEDKRYHITLRSASGSRFSIVELERRLGRIPTLEAIDRRNYAFGEADADGRLAVTLEGGAGEEFETVAFSIPRPWVTQRGPQVFALLFMLRDWLGMEAYDPQIRSVLDKETVLQGMVAMRQAQRERDANQGKP